VSDWIYFEENIRWCLHSIFEIKLLNLRPCKAIWGHKLYVADREGKLPFVGLFLRYGEIDPKRRSWVSSQGACELSKCLVFVWKKFRVVAECDYIVRLFLAVQLGLLDRFPFLRSHFHTRTYLCFDIVFLTTGQITRKMCPFQLDEAATADTGSPYLYMVIKNLIVTAQPWNKMATGKDAEGWAACGHAKDRLWSAWWCHLKIVSLY
jgi:hypothetical protein